MSAEPGPLAAQRSRGSILGLMLVFGLGPPLAMAWLVSVVPAPKVEEVTVVNSGTHRVNVDVTGADRKGWLDLGGVDPEGTLVIQEVTDQGELWVFRFSDGRVGTEELLISRSRLDEDGGTVAVPSQSSGLSTTGSERSPPADG
jgi:hypothetical protein